MASVIWPLTFNHIREGSLHHTFGNVRPKKGKKGLQLHQGWDFEAPLGTPVYAIGDGKVQHVRHGGDYGRQVCMSFDFNGQELYAFYAHLSHYYVTTGQDVTKGMVIGTTGNSGNAKNTAPHLHFEIRDSGAVLWGGGKAHRRSPLTAYHFCPLKTTIIQVLATAPKASQ